MGAELSLSLLSCRSVCSDLVSIEQIQPSSAVLFLLLCQKNSILIIYHTVKKEKIMVHSCVFGLIFTGIVFFVILPWGAVNLILSWSCVIVNDNFFFVKPDPMVCSPNVLQIHIWLSNILLLCSLSFKDWLRYLKSHSRIWYR